MKTLILVRHAKSSWDDPFQDDFDRPLNKRGRSDAPRMATRLTEKDLHPGLLLSSPAQRALSTCMLIAEGLGYPPSDIKTDRRLYRATDEDILKVVQTLDDTHEQVMLFAHNPGLTDFANRVTQQPVTDDIPTCGVVALQLPVSSWKDVRWESGHLMFYDYPKNNLK
jgi:phosphohistidine phosphatase